jgi:lysophospholipase L1-like esterase
MSKEINLIVFGDELVAGKGDPRSLGWLGRVLARTEPAGVATAYPVAIPGDSILGMASRWEAEVANRLAQGPEAETRLVFGIGWGDIDAGVSVARARLALAGILDRTWALELPAFVVGPPPRRTEENEQIAAYSAAYAEVAARRNIPYVEVFAPLVHHEQWVGDMRASGATWPGQYGYGLITWLVLHSDWQSFIGNN